MIHYIINYDYEKDQRMKYKGLPTQELKEERQLAFSNEEYPEETTIAKEFIKQLKEGTHIRQNQGYTTNYDE